MQMRKTTAAEFWRRWYSIGTRFWRRAPQASNIIGAGFGIWGLAGCRHEVCRFDTN